jgi:single-stranded-DNA-specific exonuclease
VSLIFLKDQEPVWVYPVISQEWVQTIIGEFNVHPVIAQILASRGFKSLEEIHNFLYAKLPNLFDPSLFNDMDKAVERIDKAIKSQENILIYGDNDVDGMTATALLVEFLRKVGCNVFFFIPGSKIQKKEIISDAIEFATAHKCTLLITVDCGTTAANEIADVSKYNIDVIVTDHHEPTSKIPNCIAVLNPKLPNNTYPNRDITGVGVAFKLAHALTNYLTVDGDMASKNIDLKNYLDLVALGTIADMGSLTSENRILVRYGLKQLKKTKRIGLLKLFHISDLNVNNLMPVDIASKIAPRLNSLGRIADPTKGVDILLTKNEEEAERLAIELDKCNIERQKVEKKAADDVDNYIKNNPKILNEKALALHSDKWHPGIIPIIAARMVKQFNRPSMLIATENGLGKGSLRTISEFSLLPILKQNENILINFGGHDFAAGLTVKEENIEELKKGFIEAANKALKDEDLIPKLFLDAAIQFNDLTFDFMESLSLLEPYGNGNPSPILYTDATQTWPPKIIGQYHLKLYFEQEDRILEGIGFGMINRQKQLKKKNPKLRIAFTPHVNIFLNKSSIQLHIKDFQVL